MKLIKTLLLVTVVIAIITAVLLNITQNKISKNSLITGDVENSVLIGEVSKNEYITAKLEGGSIKGIPLKRLVELSTPISDQYSVLLIGYDGLFAQLNGNEMNHVYIVNRGDTWDIAAPNHPINANIKDIEEIVVVDETGKLDLGVNIVSQTENLYHTTPGNMLLQDMILYPYLDGQTQADDKNEISLYKQKKLIPISSIIDEEITSILVMGKEGEYEYFTELAYLELNGNKINYMEPKNRVTIQDIAGIIVNPPNISIMDTFDDSLYYLNRDEKVMLIFVDGLGYHQYEYAMEKGIIPHMERLGEAKIANSVYQPVTNAGFSAMVTGVPPSESGIKDRTERIPKVPTIFDHLEEKKHVLIEADGGILKLNTRTIYSIDENNDGSTDKEVYKNAINEMQEQDYNFFMVHFHGVDDSGHTHGDLDNETISAITEVDGYIGELVDNWDGRVILTSDHGMHSTEEGGNHGVFRYEDLFVPYIAK